MPKSKSGISRWALLLTIVMLSGWNLRAQESPDAASAPVSVGIVVDNSGSYRMIFDRVVSSTNSIIDSVGPGDEGFFVTFVDAPKIALRQEMTTEAKDLRDASDNMFIEGGQTALVDAVVFAAKYMMQHGGVNRSRVIVLISDGDDRGSSASVEEAVKVVKEAKARVLVLGLYEEKFNSKVVDRLVKETGGAKFVPKIPKETPAAVAGLLTAMRSK